MKLRYPVKNFQRLTYRMYLKCHASIDMCLNIVCEHHFHTAVILIYFYISSNGY